MRREPFNGIFGKLTYEERMALIYKILRIQRSLERVTARIESQQSMSRQRSNERGVAA